MENELAPIYQEISEVIYAMIPEDWDKVVLYAEIGEGYREVFFYYYPVDKDQAIHSLDIVDLFKVERSYIRKLQSYLYDWFEKMQNVFKQHGQEPWTNLTLTLDKNGKLKVNFDYENLSDVDRYEQIVIWKYKNLGIKKEGELEQRIIDNFLRSQ